MQKHAQIQKAEKLHRLPADMRKALVSSSQAQAAWKDITPLAKNEWICWVISVKKQETRDDHVRRLVEDLAKGKRRPCCFAGCFHRPGKVIPAYLRGRIQQ